MESWLRRSRRESLISVVRRRLVTRLILYGPQTQIIWISYNSQPDRGKPMRLTVFGATGGIGRQLLAQAIAAGHDVTAVARNPRDLPPEVRVVTADLSDPDPAVLA